MPVTRPLAFRPSPERDPDGSRLRTLLSTYGFSERARELRELMVHVVAVMSVFLWVHVVWPQLVPPQVGAITSAAWAATFAGLLVAVLSEVVWRRRLSRCLSDLQPPPEAP